jgi:excisionase family DNA binding protein
VIPDPAARACVTADEAFAELGIDRTTGYRAIKEGTFPLPVIRVGRLIRVPTAALRRLLATTTTTAIEPDGHRPVR